MPLLVSGSPLEPYLGLYAEGELTASKAIAAK